MLSVNIIYNKANTYGLAADAAVLTEAIRAAAPTGSIGQIHTVDPREPPRAADIQFHLEIPVYAACPWARYNFLIANIEHFNAAAYGPYMHSFDQIWVRDDAASATFEALTRRLGRIVPWTLPKATRTALAGAAANSKPVKSRGFVSFIGGSETKAAATKKIVAAWRVGDPPLRIYTTRTDFATEIAAAIEAAGVGEKVTVEARELDTAEMRRLQVFYPAHLIASEGEGFGYAAAEAEAAGAFALMTRLPVFTEYYSEDSAGVSYIDVDAVADRAGRYAIREDVLRQGLERAFLKFYDYDEEDVRVRLAMSATRAEEMEVVVGDALRVAVARVRDHKAVNGGARVLPPVLMPADCPPISIVTLTYNRRKFIDLAFLNLMITDYPRDKIEWIVVEDSDDQDKASSDKIFAFAGAHPEIKVGYVPLATKTSIGAKRNAGIERAHNDIILMMDDDDYYPETSIRRRVAWLLKGRIGYDSAPAVAACTMLAMYDLMTGKSAVNVPPWGLGLGARVSEATLTFNRSFWETRRFPEVGMAEAEGWLEGRERDVIEIPPQQIIVAMSHGNNVSSRRVPADAPVSCFWGFEKELLVFLHGLAGVKIEEERGPAAAATTKTTKKRN
jgi:hypothetical protein